MRSRTLLPLAGTVAAVTAVVVTVALVQPDNHEPRPLRLAAGGATSGGTRDAIAQSFAAAAPSPGSGYTLTGTLPAGQPDDAPAYTLPKGPADVDAVTALASALHAGTPVRDGTGWRAGGLFVSGDAGQSWYWSPCAIDTPLASGEKVACAAGVATAIPAPSPADGGTSPNSGSGVATPESSPGAVSGSGSSGSGGVAVAPPPPSPAPEPSPMSQDAVRAAVTPVFESLGLDVRRARVEGWPYGGSASLTPTVGGFEAYGLQTSVQVDRDGKVQGANGFLGVPEKGDTYPLVTALQAYGDLPPAMTTMMLCPVSPDGKGCGAQQPLDVTGARLGLMVQPLTSGDQALVPAWLFEVKGWTEPMPVVAVQAKYLASPQPSDDPASTKPEPLGSTEPGSAGPPVPPASTEPAPTRQMFPFDKAARGTRTDEVVVTYGDSSSCRRTNVTHVAKEDSTTVYVGLEADAQDTGTACTQDYRIMNVVVTLQAPLGDRKVIDVTTGKAVPLS